MKIIKTHQKTMFIMTIVLTFSLSLFLKTDVVGQGTEPGGNICPTVTYLNSMNSKQDGSAYVLCEVCNYDAEPEATDVFDQNGKKIGVLYTYPKTQAFGKEYYCSYTANAASQCVSTSIYDADDCTTFVPDTGTEGPGEN